MQKINAAFVTHTRGYTKLKRCVGSVRVRFKTSEERDALRKKGISLSLSLSLARRKRRARGERTTRASLQKRERSSFPSSEEKEGHAPQRVGRVFFPLLKKRKKREGPHTRRIVSFVTHISSVTHQQHQQHQQKISLKMASFRVRA